MSIDPVVHLLCAGAAQGVVKALQSAFEQQTGARLQAHFGPVGLMKERLLGGDPCDVLVISDSLVRSLQADGQLAADGAAPLGRVGTGIAVRALDPIPRVDTREALERALLDASELYFPDPQRATAGIHFVSVLDRLGIRAEVADRCRYGASGAASMSALVHAGAGAIGCTQISEILYTDGVTVAGALPGEFALTTLYTAACASRAAQPELARRFVGLLAGDASRRVRLDGGFDMSSSTDPHQETP